MPIRDYRQYVGGDWKWIQEFQMEFITKSPEYRKDMKFLDLGCGSLRLGSQLISELDAGKYIGLDINEELVKTGLEHETDPDVIKEKKPQFIFTDNFDLSAIEEPVDYVWVYAVFIHINDDLVLQALANVRDKMSDDAVMYSTMTMKDMPRPKDNYVYDHSQRIFYRSPERIEEMYTSSGLSFEIDSNAPKQLRLIKSKKL